MTYRELMEQMKELSEEELDQTVTVYDEEKIRLLRAKTNRQPNGKYATSICIRCEEFLSHPNGDTATAEITDGCKACYKPKVIWKPA